MVLVTLYRSGPLRQRIAKGYGVYVPKPRPGAGAAELVAALLASPPPLPAGPSGQSCAVYGGPRTPAALWIDTGRVSLHDPAARAHTAGALAASVAQVAAEVGRRGGLLLPTGWSQQPDPAAGLCADLHSVEVLGPVQRELFTNLARAHTAPLIALTGRQLYGPGGVSPGGSARLSRVFDQFGTRYLDSCAPQHLERVRTRLRQGERLGRLEAMDVNVFGEPAVAAQDDVTLRLFDAQITVASTLAHALLVQALSMHARDLERTGCRAPAVPQPLVEQNRARAVAHGLAAELRAEGGELGKRGGGGGAGAGAGRAAVKSSPKMLSAGRAVLGLLHELLPYFRQLDATVDELAPLFTGVELAESATVSGFVRNENDLLARWRAQDAKTLTPQRLAQCLTEPGWLTTDHAGAVNSALAPGSWAAARIWLAECLTAPARREGDGGRADPKTRSADGRGTTGENRRAGATDRRTTPGGNRHRTPDGNRHQTPDGNRHQAPDGKRHQAPSAQRARPSLPAEQLLDRIGKPDVRPPEVLDALRAFCLAADGALDLTRPLRSRGKDGARELRRALRPRPAQRTRCAEPLSSWDDSPANRAVRTAGEQGVALLHWDLPAQDRSRVRECLDRLGPAPGGVRHVLLTDTTYTAGGDERRGTVEVLLVGPGEEATR
ncbi:hypothetical protein OK074_5440 [Actinobacteria bacterium OK074]|nr:hypothetical protein OK074_5440 [Actinobacteria bacterium OK074]